MTQGPISVSCDYAGLVQLFDAVFAQPGTDVELREVPRPRYIGRAREEGDHVVIEWSFEP